MKLSKEWKAKVRTITEIPDQDCRKIKHSKSKTIKMFQVESFDKIKYLSPEFYVFPFVFWLSYVEG